ncbi:uncharacterized protein LOC144006330 isoform X2 [Festucalex cinctus]
MNQREDCSVTLAALTLLSAALFVSLCVNAACCITRRASLCADSCCCVRSYTTGRSSKEGGRHFVESHQPERREEAERHTENPIYGNIAGSEECDALRVLPANTRFHASLQAQQKTSHDALINYASLDLNVAKQRQQKLHGDHSTKARQHKLRDDQSKKLSLHVTGTGVGPRWDFGSVASQGSVYLNSEYVAQETDSIAKGGMWFYSEDGKVNSV